MDPVPSPAFFDMTRWMADARNLTTYRLLQFYGRTPTSREVDIAELQEAWNKANPLLVPLTVDGIDSARTEEALRGWLERLRTEEFVRLNIANPWITYIPMGVQSITLPVQITTSSECTITDKAGNQYVIQSKL